MCQNRQIKLAFDFMPQAHNVEASNMQYPNQSCSKQHQ